MIFHVAVLDVKTADGPARRFSGIATTPEVDRQGDSVDPLGADFTNPIPLLWHHDKERPIGRATLYAPTRDGIRFEATIPIIDEPGPLRDRVNEAWQSLRAGLIRGVSIGHNPRPGGAHRTKSGFRYSRTEICELSLVTVPANMSATTDLIKSLDLPHMAALGPNLSGVSDRSQPTARKNAANMTTQEQIAQFENSRAAKVARMGAIMGDASDATLPDDKREEYDGLSLDVKGLDEHLVRAHELERLQSASATPVTPRPGLVVARAPVVSIKSNIAPGTAFVRAAMALVATKGSRYEAIEYSKRWDRETPEVGLYLKAAVAPGNTTDPAWAGPLAAAENITNEFVALLRPATILGKIPGLRKVPFNAAVPIQTAGGSYGWVGQGLAKPVTALAFATARLEISKAAGIIVLTEELVKLSNPSAEDVVRADMIAGIAAFLDQQFIDPAVAYLANVHPASITNGVAGTASSQNPYTDLLVLLQKFATAGIPLAGSSLILSETNALSMAFQRDISGARMFPGVSLSGGTAEGINVVTSNVAGTNVVLVNPNAVLYADDGGVTIDLSREAAVQMDSAPAPADATTVLVSLWQNNLVGLRAERFINWKRVINAGVAIVTGATYPAVISPTSVPGGDGLARSA